MWAQRSPCVCGCFAAVLTYELDSASRFWQPTCVTECGHRIPRTPAFHVNGDGSLCLGSNLRLLLQPAEHPSLLGFPLCLFGSLSLRHLPQIGNTAENCLSKNSPTRRQGNLQIMRICLALMYAFGRSEGPHTIASMGTSLWAVRHDLPYFLRSGLRQINRDLQSCRIADRSGDVPTAHESVSM